MANGPIGFIGLGIMGKPMARESAEGGPQLMVYDIVPAGWTRSCAAGAEGARSPKDVAEPCELIITMLPDGPDVEKAVLGPERRRSRAPRRARSSST